MSFVLPGEKIIETKKCRLSGQEFIVTDKDLEFYDKVSPVFGGKKYSIPSPTLCPDERQKRRLAFRNERKMYKRKCDKTGQEIISIYSPDKSYTVYDQKVWWSDDWNPLTFGRAFDFEKPFFEQFDELMQIVPTLNIINAKSENSEYTNYSSDNKNCYLVSGTSWTENVLFSSRITQCKDMLDCHDMIDSSWCYECQESTNLSQSFWSRNSHNSSDLIMCYGCQNCHDCYNCVGLVGKQYHINNIPATKEDFLKAKSEQLRKGIVKNTLSSLTHGVMVKNLQNLHIENCVGDNLGHCENCYMCFSVKNSKQCRFSQMGTGGISCMDTNYFDNVEYIYDVTNTHENYGGSFGALIWFSRGVLYGYSCFNSHELFGCSSLKNAHHCVLNTSYSVAEYEKLCGQIIDHMRSTGEWGEFFPHSLSPFGYNESVAQEYFPMTESEVGEKGWNWYAGENKNTYIGPYYSPLPISHYDERVVGFDTATKNINECLNGITQCEVTEKPFKIIKQELAFYIENSIPIPTKHPDQRHKERMDLRNPRKLYERTCTECQKEIITTYAPERPEKVLCEECYRKLVY